MKKKINDIKVIETSYDGIIYRSRTEARWAAFMSYIGVDFVYEPECFILDGGVCYVPDFWLPDIDCFLEIKPEDFIENRQSPTELLSIETQKSVITFFGQPYNPSLSRRGERGDESGYIDGWASGGQFRDSFFWFCCCPKCKKVGIQFMGRADRIKCNCPKSQHGDKGYNYNDEMMIEGYNYSKNCFRKYK